MERHWNADLCVCNQILKVFVFICIGLEYLGTFCSVLFGFRKCNKINYIAHPLRIAGISVTSTPDTPFFHFWSIKPMRASYLRNLKMSEFRFPCNWYSTAIGSSTLDGRGLPIGQLCLYLIIVSLYLVIVSLYLIIVSLYLIILSISQFLNCENVHRNMFLTLFYFHPHRELS